MYHVHNVHGSAELAETLKKFATNVGIPAELFTYIPALTRRNITSVEQFKFYHIKMFQSEPMLQWQNLSEKKIGIVKPQWKNSMSRTRIPKRCGVMLLFMK